MYVHCKGRLPGCGMVEKDNEARKNRSHNWFLSRQGYHFGQKMNSYLWLQDNHLKLNKRKRQDKTKFSADSIDIKECFFLVTDT